MIRKILFPFSKHHIDLNRKWWHRLFVVLYSISVISFVVIAFVVSFGSTPGNVNNVKIVNNLRDYTKNSDGKIINTIPQFLNQSGNFGCLRDNKVEYLSTYFLQDKSICNADFFANIDETARALNNYTEYTDLSFEEIRKTILEHLSDNGEKRYCFMSNDLGCTSDKVVNYTPNTLFYLQAVVYPLLATYLFSILLQLIYYKVFIYIIYGKK